MKKIAVAVAGLLIGASSAWAQTCASPIAVQSLSTYTGSTCDGTAGVDIGTGGTQWPAVVFGFQAGEHSGAFTIAGEPGLEFYVFQDSCGNGEAPVIGGLTSGGSIQFPEDIAGVLNEGSNYVVVLTVSADTPPPSPTEPACGPYTLTTPQLPVELQSFSVD